MRNGPENMKRASGPLDRQMRTDKESQFDSNVFCSDRLKQDVLLSLTESYLSTIRTSNEIDSAIPKTCTNHFDRGCGIMPVSSSRSELLAAKRNLKMIQFIGKSRWWIWWFKHYKIIITITINGENTLQRRKKFFSNELCRLYCSRREGQEGEVTTKNLRCVKLVLVIGVLSLYR